MFTGDCGTCLCFVTRSSTIFVGELRLETQLSSAQPGRRDRFVRAHVGQLHHCDGLIQNRQWHLHIYDLLDDSLWDMHLARELRLRTIVFAGCSPCYTAYNVAPFLVCILSVFFAKSFSRRVPENSDWLSFRSQLIFVSSLCILLRS